MDARLRTKVVTIGIVALVFLSGGVAGYAAAVRETDAAEAPTIRRRAFVFEEFERTPDQQARIDAVLAERRSTIDRLNRELEGIHLRYEASSDSLSHWTGEAISRVFPPEVAAEYLDRLDERRLERKRAREEAEREPRDGARR